VCVCFAEGGAAGGGHGGPSDDLATELPPLPWHVHWIATPDNPEATAAAAIDACRAKLADKSIEVDQVSKHYFTYAVSLLSACRASLAMSCVCACCIHQIQTCKSLGQ
jgi:hypothetical protein